MALAMAQATAGWWRPHLMHCGWPMRFTVWHCSAAHFHVLRTVGPYWLTSSGVSGLWDIVAVLDM